MQTASTSMLQRRMRLGYTRAGRLVDMLERRGVISGYEGSKPRQVLITEADVPRVLANLAEAGRLGRAEPTVLEDARRNRLRADGRDRLDCCGKRGCASGSTSRPSSPRPRSARSTCARSRTRSGTSCPGPTFVRTFLRTYAEYLGLDSEDARRGLQAALRAAGPAGPAAVLARGRAAAAPRARRGRAAVGWSSASCRCCCSALFVLGSLGDDVDRRTRPRPRPTPTAKPSERSKKRAAQAAAGAQKPAAPKVV